MTNLEQQYLGLKQTLSFDDAYKELKEKGKVSDEELKQLNEVWEFIVNGEHWNDANLTKCYHIAIKAAKEKYNFSDDFIETLANAAAYFWK